MLVLDEVIVSKHASRNTSDKRRQLNYHGIPSIPFSKETVLTSTPFVQGGHVTKDTRIIEIIEHRQESTRLQSNADTQASAEWQQAFYSSILSFAIPHQASCIQNDVQKSFYPSFSVELLNDALDWDEINTLFVSDQVVLHTSLTMECMVSTQSYQRICHIVTLKHLKMDTVYMHPLLFHNLSCPKTVTLAPVYKDPIVHPSLESIADSILLSSIPTPFSCSASTHFDLGIRALKEWIKAKPRRLAQGDILAIPVNSCLLNSSPDEDRIMGMALFKVTQVQGPQTWTMHLDDLNLSTQSNFQCLYEMDPTRTRLECKDTCYSPLPRGLSKAILGTPYSPLENHAYKQLLSLIQTSLHPLFSSSFSNISSSVLLVGQAGGGKRHLVNAVAEQVGFGVIEVSCREIMTSFTMSAAAESKKSSISLLTSYFKRASLCPPCILYLKYLDALVEKDKEEDGVESLSSLVQKYTLKARHDTGYPIVVVADTHDQDTISKRLLSLFHHTVRVKAPDEAERFALFKTMLQSTPLSLDVSLKQLSIQTASFKPIDIVHLISNAGVHALQRVLDSVSHLDDSVLVEVGVELTQQDFDKALAKVRKELATSIGAPKIPQVTWEDVGGLASVKESIMDTLELPIKHPELFASGMKKRSGILFYGPPGTGKTLLAKAVATMFSLNFLSVKGPELLNMYIGESEKNIRALFQKARDSKPCIIFFDEMDSVAPKRGSGNSGGGVMDRIVSQLLAELDGVSEGAGEVFVIGATNRPDLVDEALLRPGRFDKLLYLGVSEDTSSQLKILEALTRNFKLSPSLKLQNIAEQCPFNYTGADFYALCSDAMLKAMLRKIRIIDDTLEKINQQRQNQSEMPWSPNYYLEHVASEEERNVLVEQVDFEEAMKGWTPSVSAEEMKRYKELQNKFK